MLKQICTLFLIIMSLGLGTICRAQSQFSTTLTRMEKSLFGVDYSAQADDARLKRIEQNVYGQASNSASVSQRVDKLSKDLSADLMGQEIKPTKDTFNDEEKIYEEKAPKADSNINYPIVDSLEKQVFKRDYKTDDINQRVSKLEQNVFKKTYSDDLSSRVDRLRTAIMPQRVAQANDGYDDEESDYSYIPGNSTGSASGLDTSQSNYGDDYGDGTNYNGLLPGYQKNAPVYNSNNGVLDSYQSDSSITIPLASIEKKVLKKSFPNDTVSNRLTRLELVVFNSQFTDDDEQTRLDRIASAYQAKKTAKKYDNNKYSQHMATAMQVGAFLLMILAAVL